MCGNDTDVAPHHLDCVHVADHRAVFIQDKAFRPDAHPHIAVFGAFDRQHLLIIQKQIPILHAAFEHVDGRRPQKLRHEQVHRAVIDLLRLSDLPHNALLHDDDHVRNAHRLFLIVRDKDGGDTGFLLDPPDFLACLQTESGI